MATRKHQSVVVRDTGPRMVIMRSEPEVTASETEAMAMEMIWRILGGAASEAVDQAEDAAFRLDQEQGTLLD